MFSTKATITNRVKATTVCTFYFICLFFNLNALFADSPNSCSPSWSVKAEDKILWIVNSSPNLYSPGATAMEDISPLWSSFGFKTPEECKKQFEAGSLELLNTAAGVILAVREDKGEAVQLTAYESESGKIRWERHGVELGREGGFINLGNLVLMRAKQDEKGASSSKNPLLVAFDLHDGHELWRNEEIKSKRGWMLAIPSRRVILLNTYPMGLKPSPPGLLALDLDTGMIRWNLDQSWDSLVLLPRLDDSQDSGTEPAKLNPMLIAGVFQEGINFYSYLDNDNNIILPRLRNYGRREKMELVKLDLTDGKIIWEYLPEKDAKSVISALYVSDDRVYALDNDRIIVLDRASGKKLSEWIPQTTEVFSWGKMDSKCLYSDSDRLFVYFPKGKKFQLAAFDQKTGKELWTAGGFKESIPKFTSAGNFLFFAEGTKVISLDKNTGKEANRYELKFENPIQFLSVADGQDLLLGSGSQMAKYRSSDWKEIFNTGPIPQKKISSWDRVFSTLAVAAISAYAYRSSMNSMRTLSGVPVSSPGYQAAALNAMTMQSLASQSAYLMISGIDPKAHAEAGPSIAIASAASYFVMKEPKGLSLLRVNTQTGQKAPTVAYRDDKGVNTIVDDYYGVSTEVSEHTLLGIRYSQEERARLLNNRLNSFAWGMECSRRADGLVKAKRIEPAVAEYKRAAEQLNSVLASENNPHQESAIRVNLGLVYSRLASLEKGQSDSYKEKAGIELRKVIALSIQDGDDALKGMRTLAEKLLQDLNGI